jgi:hypothetical protein
MQPLALPYWDWGRFYEKVVLGVMNGTFNLSRPDRAVNYWWGMDSGVIDVLLSDSLPEGVKALAQILKKGLIKGEISPFGTKIYDQNGILRCNGERALTAEEIMEMNWFCDNVDGRIPDMVELLPHSLDMARLLGVRREEIREKEDITE